MSIVMKNVSDEPIEVRGRVKGPERGGRPEGGLSRFRLNPHEQRIVSFDGDGGGRLRAGDTAGGVTLEFDGPYGALLARLPSTQMTTGDDQRAGGWPEAYRPLPGSAAPGELCGVRRPRLHGARALWPRNLPSVICPSV